MVSHKITWARKFSRQKQGTRPKVVVARGKTQVSSSQAAECAACVLTKLNIDDIPGILTRRLHCNQYFPFSTLPKVITQPAGWRVTCGIQHLKSNYDKVARNRVQKIFPDKTLSSCYFNFELWRMNLRAFCLVGTTFSLAVNQWQSVFYKWGGHLCCNCFHVFIFPQQRHMCLQHIS